MKILQLTDDLPPHILGGSGRIVWETAKGLLSRRHEISILTAAPRDAFPISAEEIRIHTIPRRNERWAHYRSVFSRSVEKEVMSVIDEVKPNIIHAHGTAWHTGYRWIGAACARNIPCIFTMHGVMHVSYGKVTGHETSLFLKDLLRARWTMNPLRNVTIRKMLGQCNALLAVSEALRSYAAKYGYPQTKVLRNGIDLLFWKSGTSKEQARTQLRLPQNVPLFLFAGRIGYDKGTDVLLKSLPSSAHLLVCGGGDTTSLKVLGDRFHFLSSQNPEQMRILYAACDAALVPSVYLDPFPTVCLEAMACGRPVLATTEGGAKESVIDGITGWVRDPIDTATWRTQLEWCCAHRSEMQTMEHICREHMEEHFSIDRYLDELLEVYNQCRMSGS
ncbi:glycosyltransferase family 4 protein [Candidatus Peregrinibacteria bacterium]|nr:glycosyltransferase family 4 protein [Candidatus Peregrinibacteria bacterium]